MSNLAPQPAAQSSSVQPASVNPNPYPWIPERGFTTATNAPALASPASSPAPRHRGIDHYLTFERETPGSEFLDYVAYEHDFKLINENNWDTDNGVCPAPQRNDFWADQPSGIHWETTMPNPYLDTQASDHCREHD